MSYSLTEGVQRVLAHATAIARANDDDSVQARHILWSLVLDETVATRILAEHKVDLAFVALRFPLTQVAPPSPADSAAFADRSTESFCLSDHVRQVIDRSRFAARKSDERQVATQHLLFALVSVPSEVSPIFADAGLEEAVIAELIFEREAEPLEVDIDWDEPSTSEVSAAKIEISQPQSVAAERDCVFRILDAAWNRLREGMRVVEDYARFVLDSEPLTRELKSIRHELTTAISTGLDSERLLQSRDTTHDVGTTIATSSEFSRTSASDVVRANLSRVQESLRTLEEFSKTINTDLARTLEATRYRVYSIERTLLLGSRLVNDATSKLEVDNLYLLVTRSLCRLPIERVVHEAIEGGVSIVQLREKDLPDPEIVKLGRNIREITRAAGALFIMNDRPDLAILTEADGVHVGQEELAVTDARRILGSNRIVGVSTHSIEQACQAVTNGADYIGVGPVFESGTKRFTELAGLELVSEVAASEIDVPWFAIGGIDADRVQSVLDSGGRRVAVSGCICRSEQPGESARVIRQHLDRE